jgi:hypothetical protein
MVSEDHGHRRLTGSECLHLLSKADRGVTCVMPARPLGRLDSVLTCYFRAKTKQADIHFCLQKLGFAVRTAPEYNFPGEDLINLAGNLSQ